MIYSIFWLIISVIYLVVFSIKFIQAKPDFNIFAQALIAFALFKIFYLEYKLKQKKIIDE